ncbi:MAG TPA: ferredoxin reductase family protein [Egibacteraceae bacterium]|nr:ferredoxin reductase family protein [Egibacteraceae bacterium]
MDAERLTDEEIEDPQWVPRQSLYGPAWLTVTIPSLPAVLLWLVTPSMTAGFATASGALRSLGLLAGLCAYSAFATNLVLGARLPWLERLFRSLDRLYRFHRRVGVAVGGLLAAHVTLMLGWVLSVQGPGLVAFFGQPGIVAGVVALAGFAGIVAVSLYGRMRHETFQRVHRLIGLVFIAGAVHVLIMPGVAAENRALNAYLIGVSAAGAAAWLYRSVLGNRLVRRHAYRVARISPVAGDVNQLALAPVDDPIRFAPGQFVFISIDDDAVTREAHPFSITSGPSDTELRLVIKALGDFTSGLASVLPGAPVVIEGPYGGFWHEGEDLRRQVWIAGGIGVTPFLAMARSLDLGEHEVDLYYCAQDTGSMVFLDELQELAAGEGGLRLFTVPFDSDGFLTGERVAATSDDLPSRHVFLCGPSPMMDALIPQLVAAGASRERIHNEDFRIRGR